MSQTQDRPTLYRLIEAGQLAHRALLQPLRDRGLEPGDDAVIFLLHDQPGITAEDASDELELTPETLAPHLKRLTERDLVERQETGDGMALTGRGERLHDVLSDNWDELEAALFGDLKPKRRKALGKALRRFVELLRL